MRFIAITLLYLLASGLSHALDLPSPPDGYEWVEAEDIKGAFLKPESWYFKKLIKGNSQGYFITKEDIDKDGSFFTGVTINVILNITEKTGKSASEYAEMYIQGAASASSQIKKPWTHQMGPFNSYGVVLTVADPNDGDYNAHHLANSNNQTNTLYLVIYEAPTEDWDSAWTIGEKVLGKLYINSDI